MRKKWIVPLLCFGMFVLGAEIALAATADISVVTLVVTSAQNLAVITDPVFGILSASPLHQEASTPLTLQFNSNEASVQVNMLQNNGAVSQQGLIHTNDTDFLILKFYVDWAGTGILDPNAGTNWTDAWAYVKDLTANAGQKDQLYSGGPITKTVNIGLATDVSETTLGGAYSTALHFELLNP